MATATVLALGIALIVVGALTQVYPAGGGINWIIAGIVAIIVGWVTKSMK